MAVTHRMSTSGGCLHTLHTLYKPGYTSSSSEPDTGNSEVLIMKASRFFSKAMLTSAYKDNLSAFKERNARQ